MAFDYEKFKKYLKKANLIKRMNEAGVKRRHQLLREGMYADAEAIRSRLRYPQLPPHERAALNARLQKLVQDLSKELL